MELGGEKLEATSRTEERRFAAPFEPARRAAPRVRKEAAADQALIALDDAEDQHQLDDLA